MLVCVDWEATITQLIAQSLKTENDLRMYNMLNLEVGGRVQKTTSSSIPMSQAEECKATVFTGPQTLKK